MSAAMWVCVRRKRQFPNTIGASVLASLREIKRERKKTSLRVLGLACGNPVTRSE